MLLNLETIDMCIYMLKNIKYVKMCKISLHICNRDFINRIYIILGYNSGCTKKIYQVLNIRALVIISDFIMSVMGVISISY
jgi:hypothetical protein